MTIFRFAAFVTAAASISTIGMAQESPTRFTRDGTTYIYTTAQSGNRLVIDGQTVATGKTFHLVVLNGRVTGEVADQPVSFQMRDTKDPALLLAVK